MKQNTHLRAINIDIIFGDTCPGRASAPNNVEKSLEALKDDLDSANISIEINTWQLPDSGNPHEDTEEEIDGKSVAPKLLKNGAQVDSGFEIPQNILGWASPAVLINGKNVTDQGQEDGPMSSCSIIQPTQEIVTASLKKAITVVKYDKFR